MKTRYYLVMIAGEFSFIGLAFYNGHKGIPYIIIALAFIIAIMCCLYREQYKTL